MGLTEFLAGYITKFIETTGYWSVTVLMTLESMVFPVPSEAVMPFAGFLVAEGKFTFAGVVLFATMGSMIGSWISYIAGYYGGKPFVHKFGKYVFLNQHHLESTEKFFHKYGEIAILLCRFIPIVRHLISIPAGTGKMNFIRFSIFTLIGAGLWNSFLCLVGQKLRDNWSTVMKYSKILDIIMVAAIFIAVSYFVYSQLKPKKRKAKS